MNDTKSAPFAYMVQVKNPCFSKLIFRFELREMETPNFTANCAKTAQFASPHGESREISTLHTNF